jgi:hypothetical protein
MAQQADNAAQLMCDPLLMANNTPTTRRPLAEAVASR